MGVQVDESGGDEQAGRVDLAVCRDRPRSRLRDHAVGDRDVADVRLTAEPVDDGAVANLRSYVIYGRPTAWLRMIGLIDHFGINCSDWAEVEEFYDKVLHVLGYTRQMDVGVAIGYGTDGKPTFWIADANAGEAAGANREVHIAFAANAAEEVQAFFHTALALGAEPLHEPRLWPEYHPGYYGAFVRDPDGNNVEAVFHGGGCRR